jgi:hypothetical protein
MHLIFDVNICIRTDSGRNGINSRNVQAFVVVAEKLKPRGDVGEVGREHKHERPNSRWTSVMYTFGFSCKLGEMHAVSELRQQESRELQGK